MTNVIKPFLPPLEEFLPALESMWSTRVLSNGGPFSIELEKKLATMIGDEYHVSLFCNATIALLVAQRVLGINGGVVTPAYSFVATTHAIEWGGNRPQFADIDAKSMTLCPRSIEATIDGTTAAIMPLHCYGSVCDVDAIAAIASEYDLKVIYDACHSFASEDPGGSVLRHGDISVVSFHATKVFNTFEGGMLVTKDLQTKIAVDRMKNFGFVDEVTVDSVGINGKMSEFSAALGLCQLNHLDFAISERHKRDALYRARLSSVEGIQCFEPTGLSKPNYSYFPILVTPAFRMTRDDLYEKLKENGVYARRYFYPLISEFSAYQNAGPPADHLSVSKRISSQVLCLPLYPELQIELIEQICEHILGT